MRAIFVFLDKKIAYNLKTATLIFAKIEHGNVSWLYDTLWGWVHISYTGVAARRRALLPDAV